VKRALLLLLAVASLFLSIVAPAHAQGVSAATSWQAEFSWEPLVMRSQAAASTVVRQQFWAAAQGTSGFADSLVFRRGATTATVYDTTMGYRTHKFGFPPNLGPGLSNALVDTSSVPWVVIRVRQDTTQYQFATGTGLTSSALDSVRVGAEHSYNGIVWYSCSGTNTYRFDTVFFTSGEDGLQSPSLIGVEGVNSEDAASVVLKCHPSQAVLGAQITNRTLCFAGEYVRFIIGGDYTGQFVVEAGSWKP
jgi:hypothetical protein